ncbi:MAG: corrinoid protein [Candidatus Hydrothermarchaeaceae archaeon]
MIKETIINGEIDEIESAIKKLLEGGTEPDDILKDLVAGMRVVGEKFEKKEYYVPEVLLSAHAMQKGLDMLRPLLPIEKANIQGTIIIGTVEGDVHDIGKNLVAMFIEGAGFQVHNLGRDVPISLFVEKAKEIKPDIVGLSAMMSTSMEKMQEIIEEFERNNLRDKVAFMIGGAAVTEDFVKEIGADGYAEDATKAVRLCERLMKARK